VQKPETLNRLRGWGFCLLVILLAFLLCHHLENLGHLRVYRLVSHRTKADASRYKKKPGLAGRKVFEVEYYRESTRHNSHAISSSAVCGLCLYAGHVPHAAEKTVTNRAKSIKKPPERLHIGKQ
jgi:hypothetical protein